MTTNVKIVVEKHPDTNVAYPIGLKGVVIGQGATCEGALEDVRSAIALHIETSGTAEFEQDDPVVEALIAETCVSVCVPKVSPVRPAPRHRPLRLAQPAGRG